MNLLNFLFIFPYLVAISSSLADAMQLVFLISFSCIPVTLMIFFCFSYAP